MTLRNRFALTVVDADSSSTQTEAAIMEEVWSKPKAHIADFELWCRERGMLIEISDADYCEPRLSITGLQR
ncbi:MAG: hypothetical protein ACPG55_05850 [Luminiphilus sp.]